MNFTDDYTIIVSIIIVIALFFIFREVVLWYYKINKRTELMEKQYEILKKIFVQLGGEIIDKEDDLKDTEHKCPNCNSAIDESFVKCPFCQTKLTK